MSVQSLNDVTVSPVKFISVFVTKVCQAHQTQNMGRLSEDIMALFGVKPFNQQTSVVKESAESSAPVGVYDDYIGCKMKLMFCCCAGL